MKPSLPITNILIFEYLKNMDELSPVEKVIIHHMRFASGGIYIPDSTLVKFGEGRLFFKDLGLELYKEYGEMIFANAIIGLLSIEANEWSITGDVRITPRPNILSNIGDVSYSVSNTALTFESEDDFIIYKMKMDM